MSDPINPQNWWVAFLEWLEKVIKENWSGLAVLFYSYEEKKIDSAKQEEKTAELKEKMAENENAIREDAASKSDDDIIAEQLSYGSKHDKH
jgi:hypothetical protein